MDSTLEHAVLFYDAETFLLDSVAAYLTPALKTGRRGVVVCTPEHRVGIEQRLERNGLRVTNLQASGTFVARDARATLSRFMLSGVPRAALFEQVVDELVEGTTHPEGPMIFGEMVALLVGDGLPEAALALESLWNTAQTRRPFSLLCAYPIQHFDGDAQGSVADQACRAHGVVLPAVGYSELQRALKAERAARDAAEAALRARDEFLSTASHELRTPMAVLGVQAQMLLRRWEQTGEIEPERLRHGLETIATQSNKLGRLVNQLLDVSRLDGRKLTLEPTVTDLVELVRDVVNSTLAVSDARDIRLRMPASLSCTVDPLRIEQVVVNLLDNAVKYSPEHEPIEVALERVHDGIRLSVRDHGPGIPPGQRDNIFERYFQAHPNGTQRGLGLGLYLCRTIVELHGGSIHAEFPADGGTRFVVQLPV